MSGDRKFTISFESPFYFGDLVASDSINGKGEGVVIDIVLCDDRSLYYTITFANGDCQGGIYPDEMRLLKAHSDRA